MTTLTHADVGDFTQFEFYSICGTLKLHLEQLELGMRGETVSKKDTSNNWSLGVG